MSRRVGNISIKQITAAAEEKEDGSITIPSGINSESAEVENVIQNMIQSDKIIDENDVQELINTSLSLSAFSYMSSISLLSLLILFPLSLLLISLL